ncbi:MAG: hypothetical protein AABW67_04295 [Nanoarchaeota archaeon]
MENCKYCNCTDILPCIDKNGETCSWVLNNICSECFDKCNFEEKKEFLAINEYGTYFSMISEKNQKKILEKLKVKNEKFN